MNPPANPPIDPHEPFVSRVLREQPPRRAPVALESRVWAELARRAALPWWQQSYAFWPAPIRIAFLVASAVAAAALVVGVSIFFQGPAHHFAARFAAQFTGVARAADEMVVGFNTALTLWRSVPPLWVYGSLAMLGAAYGLLMGVGAAAYRTINVSRF